MMLAVIVDISVFGDRPEPGRSAAVVVLVAFLVAFLAVRTSARLTRSVSWWPGGVESGGVHVHHLVWGICLMLLCGFLAFAAPLQSPWWTIEAVGFGVGAGLTLDEFALWVRLQDVYWSEQGRASLDAVVVACAFAALVVLGTQPFGLDDAGSIWGTVIAVAVVLGLVVVCAAKGRAVHAVVAIFVPVIGILGATRLARPSSPWAQRLYGDTKMERARRRFDSDRRLARVERRIGDAVAGAPSDRRPS